MTIQRSYLTCSVLALAGAANAQVGAKPFTVSVGWSDLLEKTMADATKASGYIGMIGYRVQTGMKSLSDTSVEASWARNSGSGNRLDVYGLQIVDRMPFSQQTRSSGMVPYWGLGIGAALDQFVGSVITGGSTVVLHSDSKLNLAAKVLLGLNITDSVFVEGAYNYNGSLEGKTLTSLTVSLGIHF